MNVLPKKWQKMTKTELLESQNAGGNTFSQKTQTFTKPEKWVSRGHENCVLSTLFEALGTRFEAVDKDSQILKNVVWGWELQVHFNKNMKK